MTKMAIIGKKETVHLVHNGRKTVQPSITKTTVEQEFSATKHWVKQVSTEMNYNRPQKCCAACESCVDLHHVHAHWSILQVYWMCFLWYCLGLEIRILSTHTKDISVGLPFSNVNVSTTKFSIGRTFFHSLLLNFHSWVADWSGTGSASRRSLSIVPSSFSPSAGTP